MEELKRRLEVLLGATPAADPDVSTARRAEQEAAMLAERQQQVAAATGHMMTGAFSLLAGLLPETPVDQVATRALADALAQAAETDADGSAKLTLKLPPGALGALAESLAKLLALAKPSA